MSDNSFLDGELALRASTVCGRMDCWCGNTWKRCKFGDGH
jgi:hypothetical protein